MNITQMSTNLLKALSNIINNPITTFKKTSQQSSNRINSEGMALEYYVRDLFCNTLELNDLNAKNLIYSENFSYLGNQNNPPDLIIKGGDAIEIKKIQSFSSPIALNSSYPKDKLYVTSSMITQACRDCESDWQEKDIIYAIGIVKEDILKGLWFIHGTCYAAEESTYTRIRDCISQGIQQLENIEFAPTNELGRVNRVDPLGITYLRIRGMWGIENPIKVYNYLFQNGVDTRRFFTHSILTTEKYMSFPESDRNQLESLMSPSFNIQDVKLRSPNNPARLIDGKLLSFTL